VRVCVCTLVRAHTGDAMCVPRPVAVLTVWQAGLPQPWRRWQAGRAVRMSFNISVSGKVTHKQIH